MTSLQCKINAKEFPFCSAEDLKILAQKYSQNDGSITQENISLLLTSIGCSDSAVNEVLSVYDQQGTLSLDHCIDKYVEVATQAQQHKNRQEFHARYRGLSLNALLKLVSQYDLWNVPTYKVVCEHVTPLTSPDATGLTTPVRMCDLLDIRDVGEASVFVSHSWGNPFGLIVAACGEFEEWLKSRNEITSTTYYWVDTHAIIQHKLTQQSDDLRQLEEVIQHVKYTLLVLDDNAAPLTRAWCLYEIATTILSNSKKLHILAGHLDDSHQLVKCERAHIWSMFYDVKMENAEATFPSDLEMIFARAQQVQWEGKQGFEAVNWMLQRALIDMKFDADAMEANKNIQKQVYVSPRASYEITKRLGEGSYGRVYSACRNNGETQEVSKVCVKVISNVYNDLVDAQRIAREIWLHHEFNHENIIKMRDAFEIQESLDTAVKSLVLVYDLMDSDLYRIIRSKQVLAKEHIQYFSYQLIRALAYMHARGVVHRDIKPHNVLVNVNCDLKIADFGQVRQANTSTAQPMTEYVVMRWYRSIELCLGCKDYGTGVDIWAVGCIIGEMHTRSPLFAGKDYMDQIKIITSWLGAVLEEDQEAMGLPDRARQFLSKKCSDQTKTLRDKFVDAEDIYHVVSSMLMYNPAKRISAKALLQSEYFSSLYDSQEDDYSKETMCIPVQSSKLESQEAICSFIKEIASAM